jgi:hypothetical protein
MNPFVAEHPLASASFRLSKRAHRLLIAAVLSYPVYLILFGPFYALDGRDVLNFMPEKARMVFYFPVAPVYCAFETDNWYADYLNFWYADPNPTETTR